MNNVDCTRLLPKYHYVIIEKGITNNIRANSLFLQKLGSYGLSKKPVVDKETCLLMK